MKYTKEEILSKVDHTLLKPEATWPQIQALCDDAIKYHTASVCINTCYVKQAVQYMAGRVAVCCVVGFPLGAMDTASKCFEAKTAEGTNALLQALHADPASTLYVGDSNVDVETAHNANLPCCGAVWGFRTREELNAAGAEYLAENSDELYDVIMK